MPVRVEFIREAMDDLTRYAPSGNLPLFLKKLIRLEEIGKDAGLPLGGGLTNWRKIIVGNRDWRIIVTVDPGNTVATVWVIGDRADAACYAEAQHRVAALTGTQPEVASLAAAMFEISQTQRAAKRTKHRKR
jgi:mRNA interferase RelE/StbE